MRCPYLVEVTFRVPRALVADVAKLQSGRALLRRGIEDDLETVFGPGCQVRQVRLLTEDGEEVTCSD